jgi:hypothetical protein
VLSLDGTLDWIDGMPPPSVAAAAAAGDLFAGLDAAAMAPAPAQLPVAPAPASVPSGRPPAAGGTFVRRFDSRWEFRRYGTFVHALLSRVEWSGNSCLTAVEGWFARTCPAPEKWQTEAMECVRRCLGERAVAEALARPAGRVTLWRERPFETVIGGVHVSGVFDRVTIRHDAAGRPLSACLLEFKTDHLGSDESAVRNAVARHERQTQLYRAALSRLTGLSPDKVTGLLLFTSRGLVVPCAGEATGNRTA